jgi:hypothetical protein
VTADYPIDAIPATPEYVLDVFRDWHRFGLLDDEPTFETSVRELANILNDTIMFWRELARSLNAHLGLDVPAPEWEGALSPMRARTVRDVCEFVAARLGTRPAIRPWQHIAGDCLPAGVFLTVRSLLARDGADPDGITPSTPLETYLVQFFGKPWLQDLTRLAPGRLPSMTVDYGLLGTGARVVGLASAAILLGLVSNAVGAVVCAGAILGLACLLMPVALLAGYLTAVRPPRRVELTGLHTFRDLAYALAGQQPRRALASA